MPRACTVCGHPDRDAIDAALAANRGSIRGVSRQYRVSPDALERHARAHVPRTLARVAEVREDVRAEDLAGKVKRLEEDARRLLAKAEADGDYRCAVAAVKTLLDVVSLLHRVAEERRAGDRGEDFGERARSDTTAIGLRAANLLAAVAARHPEALVDDGPEPPIP